MINKTMMQFFHWYVPDDGSFWKHLQQQAPFLAGLGIDAVWIPPAHKGKDGPYSNGYDLYDLYDLGEFDQKGSVRTKYGTKKELADAVDTLRKQNIRVYADIVLNHMGGADETERIRVRRANEENRNEFISEPFEIEAYTKFTFPGRKGKYSQFLWDHMCFTGVDYAKDLDETAIFSILNEYGEGWEDVVDTEKGNFDYLMFCDIEFRNKEVREELKRFGGWFLHEVGFDGMRLDAVKHISPSFLIEWIDHMRGLRPEMFAVGEYWTPGDLQKLLGFLDAVDNRMSLFDAPLHDNFYNASLQGKDYDLSGILNNSLVAARPGQAVMVVDNHDTQPLQTLEAPVEPWFKPHCYAITLLREAGYPCIFYPDLYGAKYTGKDSEGNDRDITLPKCDNIEDLVRARQKFAYGAQRDYFDHPNCIGWTREGTDENNGSGCAVVLSNSEQGIKEMEMGKRNAGKTFVDILRKHPAEVQTNETGLGTFFCNEGSVSVWIDKKALNI